MIWVGERAIMRNFSIMVENAPEIKEKKGEKIEQSKWGWILTLEMQFGRQLCSL